MKVSTSLTVQYDNIFSPFPACQWEEGLAWVKETGFDAVEIILSDPDLMDRSRLMRRLEQLNLPVSTISTGQAMGLEGLSLTSTCRQTRQATIDRLKRDMDFAAELGRPHVTIGLIRGRGGQNSEEIELPLLRESLKVLADYAEKRQIVLNLEAINRYECQYLNDSLTTLGMIEEIGAPPCMGVLYDTFHSNIEDENPLEAISQLRGKITNVHLADSNRRLPGEGHINFHAVRRQLERIGYTGYAALEVLNCPSAGHIRDNAGKSIRYFLEK